MSRRSTDIAGSKRAKDRSDVVLPVCAASKTDEAKPERAKLCIEGGRPEWRKSKTNRSNSTVETPEMKRVNSK